jgi:hypothetical protein
MKFIHTFIIVFLFFGITNAENITLENAIKKNYVKATIKNNPESKSSHQGECIEIELINLSSKSLNIKTEPGRFLMPDNPDIQQMMIVQELPMALAPKAQKKFTINAFCSEANDGSPKSSTVFAMGGKATGSLLKLADYINEKKYFSNAGQSAVWCLTDDYELYTIHSSDSVEHNNLRQFIHEETGQPLVQVWEKHSDNNQSQYSSPEEISVRDTIRYQNREVGTVSMAIYNEDDEEIMSFFKDRPTQPRGSAVLTFTFTYSSMPIGKYYFKLVRNESEVLYFREFFVEAAEER